MSKTKFGNDRRILNRLPGVAERPELLGAHAEGLAGAVDAALLDVLGARLHDLLVDAQQPRREVRLANLLHFPETFQDHIVLNPHFFDLLGSTTINAMPGRPIPISVN